MTSRRLLQSLPLGLLLAVAACSSEPSPDPTPAPTTFPMAPPEAAAALASEYLDAWAAGDYEAMYATLDPAQRERYPIERFTELHAAFVEMARMPGGSMAASTPPLPGLMSLLSVIGSPARIGAREIAPV